MIQNKDTSMWAPDPQDRKKPTRRPDVGNPAPEAAKKRRTLDKELLALGLWADDRALLLLATCVLGPRRHSRELRVLSFDLGIALSFCIVSFVPPAEKEEELLDVRILHWATLSIADASATRFDCSRLALEQLNVYFPRALDVDVVLLEDQPPTRSLRTGALSWALFGFFWTRYEGTQTRVAFIHPKEKNIFCFQIGAEPHKEHRSAHSQNKELSVVGCTLFLQKLQKQHKWASACLQWFANRKVQHDFADSFCQAMAFLTFKSDIWIHIADPIARAAARPTFTTTNKKRPRAETDPVVTGRRAAKAKRKEPVGALQYDFLE